MGEPPTHPELLDYLASRFIESGWSVKAMHRMIMLSSAYQMSSQPIRRRRKADPENRLFSRFNRAACRSEEIRDGMLAIDGTLDLTMGGTLQKGFGTERKTAPTDQSDPDKVPRRTSVHSAATRESSHAANLFDFGDATTPDGSAR